MGPAGPWMVAVLDPQIGVWPPAGQVGEPLPRRIDSILH